MTIQEDVEIDTSIIRTLPELKRLANEWDGFIADSASDIYFTVDWLEAWWRYYGKNHDLACLFMRHEGHPIAALPFCTTRRGIWPGTSLVALFVGTHATIPVFQPAIRPGFESRALAAAIDILVDDFKCNAVVLSPLSGNCPSVPAAVRNSVAQRHDITIAKDIARTPHTIFSLPDTIDAFLKSLGKRQRGNYRRDLRVLEKLGPLEHRVVTGPEANAAFDRFADLHTTQWQAAGENGHFGDWPNSHAFNGELVERFSSKGQVAFFELYADGRLLSSQFSFLLGKNCFWRLPARLATQEYDKLGLGRIGLMKMIEALIDLKVTQIEAGPGHYDYKVKHGGQEFELVQLVVTRRDPLSVYGTRLILWWEKFIHFIYYRLWFLKFTKLLNIRRGRLSKAWIYSRF